MDYIGFKGILISGFTSLLVFGFVYIEILLILKINRYIKKNEYGFKNK